MQREKAAGGGDSVSFGRGLIDHKMAQELGFSSMLMLRT